MNIQFYSKNFELPSDLKDYLQYKLQHFSKYAKDIMDIHVDLSRSAHHRKGDVFRCEINVYVPKKIIRAVEQKNDMRSAADVVIDTLQIQIKKHKEKMETRWKFS